VTAAQELARLLAPLANSLESAEADVLRGSHPPGRPAARQRLGGRTVDGKEQLMDVDVLTDIEIDRPRWEVADYVSNPDNATRWYENITKVEWKSPKPLKVGSKVAFEAQFMGKKLEYTYEITEHVPGESLVMRTASGPFQMQTSYRFSDTPSGGTKLELRNLAHDPAMASAIERENRKDLARLKSILEEGRS
jgi:uncharacterized membrane protein